MPSDPAQSTAQLSSASGSAQQTVWIAQCFVWREGTTLLRDVSVVRASKCSFELKNRRADEPETTGDGPCLSQSYWCVDKSSDPVRMKPLDRFRFSHGVIDR